MTKRAWAVCDRKGKHPLLHSIRSTKQGVLNYVGIWCGKKAWGRLSADGSYRIKRISITVD